MIGGIISKLLGTEGAAERMVESVSSGLDKLVYTSEEKADDSAKERAAAREMIIRWHEATSGSNLARRVIALAVTFAYLSCYGLAGVLNVILPWVSEGVAIKMAVSSSQFLMMGQEMFMPFTLILAYYFTVAASGKVMDKILEGKKVIKGVLK
jgi:hypothetical protein